jgi:hypothetical protein
VFCRRRTFCYFAGVTFAVLANSRAFQQDLLLCIPQIISFFCGQHHNAKCPCRARSVDYQSSTLWVLCSLRPFLARRIPVAQGKTGRFGGSQHDHLPLFTDLWTMSERVLCIDLLGLPKSTAVRLVCFDTTSLASFSTM